MKCPECGYKELFIDLYNDFASCPHCGCKWETLASDEFWGLIDKSGRNELEELTEREHERALYSAFKNLSIRPTGNLRDSSKNSGETENV